MAHRKAGGTARNLRDSNPKYLGIKKNHGQAIQTGQVILRQRGTKYCAGNNVGIGSDHTLFALASGVVNFTNKRKKHFDNSTIVKKVVEVK